MSQSFTTPQVLDTDPTLAANSDYVAPSEKAVKSYINSGATTATAAGTTTLTVNSEAVQIFTGATTETVVLPVVSTLRLGQSYKIINNSSGILTVNSSGANLIQAMAAGTSAVFTVILITGTTAASWYVVYSTSPANITDLIDAGDSTLHYHASDRNLANATNPTAASAAFDAAVKTKGDALYQPLDADLTTIAGLTATTDNVIQSVGSSWASRTLAQFLATLPIAGGTYAPTITPGTNCTSATPSADFIYIRILNFVIGAGSIAIDPTAAGSCVVDFSIPVASNFTTGVDLNGNGTSPGQYPASLGSSAAEDRGIITHTAVDGTARGFRILFMYIIK